MLVGTWIVVTMQRDRAIGVTVFMGADQGFASEANVRLRGGLELLGPIVRLQIQTSSLKCGSRPRSWYDPTPITPLQRLRIDPAGVTGLDDESGEDIGDVHHRDHPASKFRSENGLSFGFTSHYEIMRAEYGDHLRDGIAGETILIDRDQAVSIEHVEHGLVVATNNGMISLDRIEVSPPCAEFSKFALRYERDQVADRTVTEAVKFLHQGVRGFYATLRDDGTMPVVSVGNLVYRRESS